MLNIRSVVIVTAAASTAAIMMTAPAAANIIVAATTAVMMLFGLVRMFVTTAAYIMFPAVVVSAITHACSSLGMRLNHLHCRPSHRLRSEYLLKYGVPDFLLQYR